MRLKAIGLAALLLAGCSQSDAPSEKVGEAAEEIVEAAQGVEATPQPAAGRYAPRDECKELPGAAEFYASLAKAVAGRDVEAFVALAAEDIKLDFGGGAGAAELRARLSADNSELWTELDELLTLGCASNPQGGMTIPWSFAQEMDEDPFQAMIVNGTKIPLLSAKDGSTLGTVSWDAVLLDDSLKPDQPFQEVSYGDIKGAYVATRMLRSPLDYRLIAASRNGRWSLTSFIAGD